MCRDVSGEDTEQVFTITSANYKIHPGYSGSGFDNDIAIICLPTEATLNNNVNIVCMPSGDASEVTTNCYSTGLSLLSVLNYLKSIVWCVVLFQIPEMLLNFNAKMKVKFSCLELFLR